MKNYKTTIIGIVGAIWAAVYPKISDGSFNWQSIVTAAIIATLGFLAKDYDVTGGTRQQ